MSLLDSDMAEFLLQLFAMGVCQETGVTVLTATGTYAACKSSVVVFYSCCGAHIQLLSLLIWWNALWDDLRARAGVGKVEVLLLSGPTIAFDLKERNPCFPGTIWSGHSVTEDIMLLPPISFLFTPQLLGHMLLSPCSVSAWQTKGSDVPCEWSRKWSKKVGFKLRQTWSACAELTSSPDCLIWQKTGSLSWTWSFLLWPHVVLISNIIISGFCVVRRACVGK